MGAHAVVQGEVAPPAASQPAPVYVQKPAASQPAPVYVQTPAPLCVHEQPSVVYVEHGRPMGPSIGRSVVTGMVAGELLLMPITEF